MEQVKYLLEFVELQICLASSHLDILAEREAAQDLARIVVSHNRGDLSLNRAYIYLSVYVVGVDHWNP